MLDSTFGIGGNAHVDTSTYATRGVLSMSLAMARQADGKLVVTGYQQVNGNDQAIVARFNLDGSLDSTFATAGQYTVTSPQSFGTSIAVQPDGKIVFGGANAGTQQDFYVWRLNSDGSPDTSFGTGGVAVADPSGGGGYYNDSRLTRLVVQPDGKILTAGYTVPFKPG